jgi:hypothetical protein
MQSRISIKACAAASALAVSLAVSVVGAPVALAQGEVLTGNAYQSSQAFAADAELPGASYATPALLAQAAPQLPPASAGLPDTRPEWPGGATTSAAPPHAAPAAQVDPRARDAWLRECRRRVTYYYDDGHRRRNAGDPGYDYCEAYLDDYFRYYAQPGYAGYGQGHHGHHMMMAPRMTMVPARVSRPAAQGPCEEVVTEEYVPERTRTIRRRAPQRAPVRRVPDKRIRVY